jgi:hypothetical protein
MFLWLPLTLILAFIYAEVWIQGVGIETEKPFVFRQFVPLIARLIASLTGMRIGAAVVLVVLVCAAGFAWSAHYLYRSFHEKR